MRYHVDWCTFCAQCVFSCRRGCLDMSSTNWELAALDQDAYTQIYGDPDDIQTFLAE